MPEPVSVLVPDGEGDGSEPGGATEDYEEQEVTRPIGTPLGGG